MTYPEIKNTAGVVVLYNPDSDVWLNIQSYVQGIDYLYVVDNSEKKNTQLVDELKRVPTVAYIDSGVNAGLASALNRAAGLALQRGYDWLLTMDQDSRATTDMLEKMYHVGSKLEHIAQVGILSPFHCDKFTSSPGNATEYTDVPAVMTSGNLLNLAAYTQIGPFEDKFFIDYIDIEYCLRLRANAYRVVQVNKATLLHNLGNMSQHIVLGKKIGTTNHPALRRYYITRNSFYVSNKFQSVFPDYSTSVLKHFWKEIGRVILFERDKLLKLSYILKGYIHYKTDTFGKLRR